MQKKAATNPVQKKASQKPDSSPSAVEKRDRLPHELKLKPVNHYGDDTGGDNKRKRKQRVGKLGRHDPCEEFVFGAAKKRRASPVKYTEEEEKWEDKVVDVTDDMEEVVEDVDDSDIFFKPDTEQYKFLFPLVKQMKITNALLKENNELLTGLLQGGMGEAGGKQQELFDPELKKLRDGMTTMTPHPLLGKFHKSFALNYTKLLLFKQQFNSVRVTPNHNPQLGNWLKNMKTQLRYLLEGKGNFTLDTHYVSYLTGVDVTFSSEL